MKFGDFEKKCKKNPCFVSLPDNRLAYERFRCKIVEIYFAAVKYFDADECYGLSGPSVMPSPMAPFCAINRL
jgi:hypothetical protein